MEDDNVYDLPAAQRRRWARRLEEAREAGRAFTATDFEPTYEEPAKVLRFPLRLVEVDPPAPAS